MKTAQDIIPNACGQVMAGFNRAIYGELFTEACGPENYSIGDLVAGFWKAEELIREGKIYHIHRFPHAGCNGYAFPYGGTWVCNTCGRNHLDKPWWIIKVQQDGNAWCCVGEGFTNLQESENYAFGDTREEAINNYYELMSKKEAVRG